MTEGRRKKLESMTADQVVGCMHRMAKIYINHSKWGWDMERHIWDLADDWNHVHEEEGLEIFMSEYYMDEDGIEQETKTGFMIEDDYYLYRD